GPAVGRRVMRTFEYVVAGVFFLLGLRCLVHWIRRPFESTHLSDQVLYGLWILSRVGLWFAVGGIFAISASISVQWRAFLDEWSAYRWYVLVPIGCAALQAITAYALGRAG